MNKSFKVVFSKARSALMVVNEATSSIQAKGTKTVIAAAAAAMIAGGAMAAEPTGNDGSSYYVGAGTTHTLLGTKVDAAGIKKWDEVGKKWVGLTDNTQFQATNDVFVDGTVNVGVDISTGTDTAASLKVKSLTSTGTINITAGNAAASAVGAGIESSGAVSLTGGSLNFLNNAGATTKPAAATEAGNDAKVYGSLTLEAKSGNVTLGQAATTDKAASVLAVKVAKDIEATITAQGAVIVDNATFANEGKLKLVGTTNGVKFAADYTQGTGNSGKLDVIGASEFTGNVKFDSVMVGAARTTAANNGVSESVLLKGNVTVKGTDKKAASFATGKLNITSGTFTVDSYATADLGEVAVSGAGTSLAVNASGAATASKMTVSQGTLTVNGDLTVKKAADTPAVAAATDPVYDLTIGTAGNTVSVSGSLTAGSVLIGTATDAALTVSGTMQADSVTVQGDAGAATLTVSGAKSSATIGALNLNKSGTVSVGNSGAVVVTGDTVFAKDSTGDFTVNGTGAKVSLKNVTFAKDATGTNKVNVQDGSVTIDGTLTANSGSLTIAGATAAATVNGKVVAAGSTKTGLVELSQGTLTLGSTADIGTETGAVKLTAGKLEAASALLLANQDSTVTDEAAKKKLLNKALGLASKNTNLSITVTDEKLSSDQIVDLQTRINDKASGAAFAVTAITDSTGKEYTELFLRDDKATSPSFNISTLAGDVHLKNIDAKVNTDKSTTLASALTVGGAAGFAHNLGVQSLIFATTAPTGTTAPVAVTVDGGKSLTLYGSLTDTAKELIQAYEYTDTTTKKVVPTAVTVQSGGKFVLGDDTAGAAQRYGNLNAEVTLTSGSMTVNNGVFTVKSLKTTANGSAAVAENANLTLKSLAGEDGAVTVFGNGVLTVESLATGANAAIKLTGSAVAPTNTKAKVAKYFRLAEATSKTDAATTLGTVTRTGATQLVVGTADDSVLTKFMADNQYTYDYVDDTADPFSDIEHVDSATLIATNVNADNAEMTGLTVFDMGSIVVEKDQLGNNKAIVRGGTVSGEIGLANVSGKSLTWDAKTGLGSVQLFDGTTTQTDGITIGDAMLEGTLVNGEAVVKVQNAEEVMPGFFLNKDMQRIYDEHLFDAASSDAQIAMLTQFSQAVNGMTSLGEIKAASQALEEGSNSAVLGGAYNAALDAGEQFNKALDRRMTVANGLNRAEGFTLWADVIGTSNQAKKLYGNSGYDLDLYGGVLGGDYTFAQYDATLGAALTVGTGSGGSKGTATSIDNDVDFVGFSVYGNKRCPIVNSKFDLGYMQTKSDISAANSMGNWSSDVKAKAFTFGFGVELPTTVGIVNVTPHAGIRYTRLDVEGRDGLFGTDDDKLNVFQAPLGVTFSGAFETSGWNLAPTFDLSVVPAFGDKDATTKYNGLTTEVITRVVDSSPVQATLGLSAQKDAFTFGINYTLGAGSDERQNHSFNANVRYTF